MLFRSPIYKQHIWYEFSKKKFNLSYDLYLQDNAVQLSISSTIFSEVKNVNVEKIEDQFIHTQFFALVDRKGKVRGKIYDGLKKLEVEQLKVDIAKLLKE